MSNKITSRINIYIPIWLDLLCSGSNFSGGFSPNLHSNMVRFIIMKLMYIKPETI